jgi:hypothetical protein
VAWDREEELRGGQCGPLPSRQIDRLKARIARRAQEQGDQLRVERVVEENPRCAALLRRAPLAQVEGESRVHPSPHGADRGGALPVDPEEEEEIPDADQGHGVRACERASVRALKSGLETPDDEESDSGNRELSPVGVGHDARLAENGREQTAEEPHEKSERHRSAPPPRGEYQGDQERNAPRGIDLRGRARLRPPPLALGRRDVVTRIVIARPEEHPRRLRGVGEERPQSFISQNGEDARLFRAAPEFLRVADQRHRDGRHREGEADEEQRRPAGDAPPEARAGDEHRDQSGDRDHERHRGEEVGIEAQAEEDSRDHPGTAVPLAVEAPEHAGHCEGLERGAEHMDVAPAADDQVPRRGRHEDRRRETEARAVTGQAGEKDSERREGRRQGRAELHHAEGDPEPVEQQGVGVQVEIADVGPALVDVACELEGVRRAARGMPEQVFEVLRLVHPQAAGHGAQARCAKSEGEEQHADHGPRHPGHRAPRARTA